MQVNGEPTRLGERMSLVDFLEERNDAPTRVVVERNGVIVPRDDYPTTFLEEEDVLEILHFVGGGAPSRR